MSAQPELRIGDAEREAAASALGEHFASGRLTRDEYDERSSAVWSAKTNSDLWPLFLDLPSPQMAQQRPGRAPSRDARATASRDRGHDRGHDWHHDWHHDGPGSWTRWRLPFLPLMLVAVVLVIALPGPPWPLLVLAALWFAGCFGRGWTGHGWHRSRRTG